MDETKYMTDAATLRRAAIIMKYRVPKQSFVVRVIVRVLQRTADWIEEQDVPA